MARNYLRDAIEACRYCMQCTGSEYREHRDSALELLRYLDRCEIRRKPRPNWTWLEKLRRACNKCVYHCKRKKGGILEVFNASA